MNRELITCIKAGGFSLQTSLVLQGEASFRGIFSGAELIIKTFPYKISADVTFNLGQCLVPDSLSKLAMHGFLRQEGSGRIEGWFTSSRLVIVGGT